MPKVSRREFLKFLAAGGIVAATGFIGFSSFTPKIASRRADASSSGQWASGPTTVGHAVHVALLRNGKVLYVGGSGWKLVGTPKQPAPFQAGIWDPSTGDNYEILPQLGEDLFCCGHAPLENGNILFAGGTLKYKTLTPNKRYWGLDAAYEFDVNSESFVQRDSMAHGRWYPSLVELDDGRILTIEGYDEFGYHNLLTEIYDPASGSWGISYDPDSSRTYTVGCDSTGCANVTGAPGPTYGGTNQGTAPTGIGLYPRSHLMPNGLVAVVGQGATRRTWEPKSERWRGAGSMVKRSYGTSVLLPLQNSPTENGKILVCGGSSTSDETAVNTADIFEPNGYQFTSRSVQSMTYERRYCNPVILPDGKVVIFGGTGKANLVSEAVYVPEMFDPETETWTQLPPHSSPRMYHSGAILLRDGRVWTMGTSYDVYNYDQTTEVFSPSYCFVARPVISGTPTGGDYGGTITIPTPDASSISRVSLLKVPTTTHHYNTDQRLIWLDDVTVGSGKVTVSAPINGKLAPPGYYMVHVLNSQGIPSEGAIIKIGAGAVSPVFYDVPSPGDKYVTLRTGSDTRAGEEVRSGSQLVGNQLKKLTVNLKKVSNPSGTIYARVRNGSDTIVAEDSIDASTLTTSYAAYQFTFSSPRTLQVNDRILIEYGGPSGVRVDLWSVDKFDGSKTRKTRYTSSLTYAGSNTQDISGKMSSS